MQTRGVRRGWESRRQRREARFIQVELISSERANRSNIGEETETHLVRVNRDAVFNVQNSQRVSTGECDGVILDRKSRGLLQRRSTRTKFCRIGVEQSLCAGDRDKRNRRYRLNIKCAQSIFTAGESPLERRKLLSAVAGSKLSNESNRPNVAIVISRPEIRC